MAKLYPAKTRAINCRLVQVKMINEYERLVKHQVTCDVFIASMRLSKIAGSLNIDPKKLGTYNIEYLNGFSHALFSTINSTDKIEWRLSWRGKLYGKVRPNEFRYDEADLEKSTHVWTGNPYNGWGREISPEEIP